MDQEQKIRHMTAEQKRDVGILWNAEWVRNRTFGPAVGSAIYTSTDSTTTTTSWWPSTVRMGSAVGRYPETLRENIHDASVGPVDDLMERARAN